MSDYWTTTLDFSQTLRRELHAHPELGWQEQQTADRIRNALTALDIPWRPCADTGTLAWLNRDGNQGRHIALRGDIDALPIVEQTKKSWGSRHEGCMHACGHDGHTATLMAAARWLKHHEADLPGAVTLIFQPAEEGGHGARRMIEEGALDSVDEIFGWHNWPAIPYGKLVCPDDIVMCGNGTFTITINGQGGHASQPELCRDPILAGSAMVMNLQQIISRRLAPQSAAVVSLTSFDAPSGPTVIPQQAVLGGSIRLSRPAMRKQLNEAIEEICESTARAYGVTCEVTIQPRYDATVNHPQQAQYLRECWHADHNVDGFDTQIALPIMASEDFSYYLKEIPGAFALIGADDGEGHHFPCHSPYYDFNDRLIPLVTRLFSRLAGAPLPPSTHN